jgi:hypothetical protein
MRRMMKEREEEVVVGEWMSQWGGWVEVLIEGESGMRWGGLG